MDSIWTVQRCNQKCRRKLLKSGQGKETETRLVYIYAWRTAKIAASNIAEEAQLNPTIYHAWVRPAFEYVDKKLTEVKKTIISTRQTSS